MGERSEAQRLEAKLAQCRLVESLRELERIGPVATLRDDDSDRRVAEPSRREGESTSRRHVQPLDVVDGDEHGTISRKQPE